MKIQPITEEMPILKGIYFLFNSNLELIYVGRTRNLKSRIRQHIAGKSNLLEKGAEIAYFAYIDCDYIKEMEWKEQMFISLLEPKYNANTITFHNEVQEAIKDL